MSISTSFKMSTQSLERHLFFQGVQRIEHVQTFVKIKVFDKGPFYFMSCEWDGAEMRFKHLGIKISTLRSFITPGWDWYTFLNERLGMFYKAARSRAQANGKVCLNHCSVRRLKVRRQSFIIWGDVKRRWQEAGRGQRYVFGPAR